MGKPHRFFFSLTLIVFLAIATFITYTAIQTRKDLRSKATTGTPVLKGVLAKDYSAALSYNVPLPENGPGDVVVVFILANGPGPKFSAPSGWADAARSKRSIVFWRKADGSRSITISQENRDAGPTTAITHAFVYSNAEGIFSGSSSENTGLQIIGRSLDAGAGGKLIWIGSIHPVDREGRAIPGLNVPAGMNTVSQIHSPGIVTSVAAESTVGPGSTGDKIGSIPPEFEYGDRGRNLGQMVVISGGSGGGGEPPPTIRPTSGDGEGPISGEKNSIGYIGCSNSRNSVDGYNLYPGNKGLFRPGYNTGSLDIVEWSKADSDAWRKFDSENNKYGIPKYVWIQICEREDNPATYDTIKQVISNLRRETSPSTIFYISPLNSYSPENLCRRVGNDGVRDLVEFADRAAADGLARRGPDLGPLTANTTQEDNCHPSAIAQKDILGKQMVDFFDKGSGGPQPLPTTRVTVKPPTTPKPTTVVVDPTQSLGGANNVTVNLRLSFQGITTKPSAANKMSVRLTLVGGNKQQTRNVEVTVNDQGVWQGSATFQNLEKRSDYYALIKGPKHIQKRVCVLNPSETRPGTYSCFQGSISIQSQSVTLDASKVRLLAGDLPQQDGIVDSYDTSLVRNIVSKPLDQRRAAENLRLADINLDGIVDSQDYSLVIASLSVRSDEN